MRPRVRAFTDLLWRGENFLLVVPFLLGLFFPVLRVDDGVDFWSREVVSSLAWSESVLLGFGLGAFLGATARIALQSNFGFTVPSLRRDVLIGRSVFAVALAVLISLAFVFFGDYRAAIAAFGCVLLTATIAGRIGDAGTHAAVQAVACFGFIILAFRTGVVERFYSISPVGLGIVSALVAGFLVVREGSVTFARARTLSARPFGGTDGGWRFGGRFLSTREIEWTGQPRVGSLSQWIRVSSYETYGWASHGWTSRSAWSLAINCGITYFFQMGDFAAYMGLMTIVSTQPRLMGNWAYPLSREQRARVRFATDFAHSAMYFAAALATLHVLYRSGLVTFSLFLDDPRQFRPWVLVMVFIWCPIVQAGALQSNTQAKTVMQSPVSLLRLVGLFLVAFTAALTTLKGLEELAKATSPVLAILTGAVLAIAVRWVYWLYVQRWFATRDLA